MCFEVDTLVETLSADEACDWSMRYQSVIGFGRAVFLESPEEKREALDIIFKRYAVYTSDFADNRIRATAVIRIDIQDLTGKASGS